MSDTSLLGTSSLRLRWQGVTAHYAYFRGAEYPMGRIQALRNAWRAAR